MRSFLLLLIALVLGSWSFAQDNCSRFYPLDNGTKFQITTYNAKNKVLSAVDYVVTNSASHGDGHKATFLTEISDKKGEIVAKSEYDIICENEVVSIDFKSLMGPDVFTQFPDMEMEASGTALEIPNNLEEGQTLPDADLFVEVDMGPMNMNMTFLMTNRKIGAMEEVTTPAGTFTCYEISYDHEFKMGVKREGTAKQWLAEGVGLVKQEDYNKKGKLISRSVLTSFTK